VPDAVSDNCLVWVSGSTKSGENVDDVSDDVFSIVASASLTVTAPNGGESWEVGSPQSVTWTTSGTVGSVKIECSTDSGVSWETVVSAMENTGSCAWDIPDTPSDNCLARVSAVDGDGEPSGVSDQVFSIVLPPSPILTVTSPNGGERLVVGSDYEITWSTVGTVDDVKIEYSTDSGTSWTEIIASTANEGSHAWPVPDAVSDNCLVRVSETDGDPSDVSDAVFSIVPPSPESITVIFPNGGESLDAGLNYDITWSSTGTIDNVNIEYSTDGGTSWAEIVDSTLNDGLHEWLVPEESSDECLVRVSRDIVEGSGDEPVWDVSDAVFSIVSTPLPSITITAPNGGEGLTAGSVFEITWTSTGNVGNVVIQYSINNGASWSEIIDATSNDGSYEWTVPDAPSEECLVQISEAGNGGDGGVWDVSDGVFVIVSDPSPCGRSWSMADYWGNDDFRDVCYGGPKFVAVGNSGKIMSSADGISWTSRTSGTGNDLYGVFYGNNTFVAVGAAGVILTSSNGIAWTVCDSGVNDDLFSAAYGANLFVVVGANGVVLTSSYGIDWSMEDSGVTNDLNGIVYGGNLFAVVGANGVILTGSDGVYWDRRYPGTGKSFRGIVYGNGMFLAVGDSGLIATSSNGTIWTVRMSSVSTGFQGAAYGNETFVVVGQDGKILTSSDGTEWLLRSSGVRNDLFGVAYSNLKFSVVGTGMILYGTCDAEGASLTKSFVGVQGAVFQKSPLPAGGKDFNNTSDNSLEMVYNDDMEEFSRQKAVDSRQFDDETPHGPNQSGYFGSATTAPSAAIPAADTLVNTYYIYSYDGKLLAEYDHNGNCVKDYIYIGNRLLAEYHPQTNKYYYYMTDQISSTRVITDDNGNVVYSAAHGPYGQIQKVWTNTYDPKLKYSGKEREGYSELDYFGARYYHHQTYRFNSVDPVINKDEALVNPQLWNLYAYCGNNPITHLDPDGREIIKIEVYHKKSEVKFYSDSGEVYTSPAALGRPRSPSPKPGTKAYTEGGFQVGAERPDSEIPAARKSWDVKDNPGNPYGPYMTRLKKTKGEFHKRKNNLTTHIHGTTGGWGKVGDTSRLGGPDPKKRRITSGCVRVPNADIRQIYKEGVKKNAPVYFKE
jgi:RHS repeat-associated protein